MNFLRTRNLLIPRLVMKKNCGVTNVNSVNGGMPIRTMSGYGKPVGFQEPNLSELPVPAGSWNTQYQKLNRKYNRHLIIGVSFWAFTMLTLTKSGLVTLNWSIPKLGTEYGAIGCVPPPMPKPKC